VSKQPNINKQTPFRKPSFRPTVDDYAQAHSSQAMQHEIDLEIDSLEDQAHINATVENDASHIDGFSSEFMPKQQLRSQKRNAADFM
jgi:hypothetical protein